MRSAAPARVAVVALACLSGAQAGCTIAGAAIGANMPRYEPTGWPRQEPSPGAAIRVRVRTVGADARAVAIVEGSYGGIRHGAIVVLQGARENEVPLQDVLDVAAREGSEWKKGVLLGAIADACLAAAVVAASSSGPISISTETLP